MFRELGHVGLDVVQESIFDKVMPADLPDLDDVVAYLNSGPRIIDMMDVADDVFDPSRQILNGSSIHTDGAWLWREDLAYYLKRHRVAVPDDLLALIRERTYVVPPLDEHALRECAPVAEDLMF
ncbi:MAG TPA: hypothetical protein VF755_28145 [Catenuloplanes sp.]